jgi:hypothetical protein
MTSRRTLLAIEQFSDNRLSARVEEAGRAMPRRTLPVTWAPWTEPLDTEGALAAYGAQVRQTLYEHPDIGKALDAVFHAPADETWSLVFDVVGELSETIRWEALQDDGLAHVALRLSPRVCRIAADAASPPLARRPMPTPLRMSAFLSAARVKAQAEFVNLMETVKAARAQGANIELAAYVAEPELLGLDISSYPGVTRHTMPADTLALELELTRTKPHLLHFFCHGVSEPTQWLEFASVQEQIQKTDGSVRFAIDRLIDCKVLQGAWAVVFNCCDGGRPTGGLNSMAFRAVAQGAAPAAIGMGAPIPAAAAAVFAKAFYTALFDQLRALAQNAGTEAEAALDFGEATAQARMQLHQTLPAPHAGCTAWSLPITYLHRQPMLIEIGPATLSKEAEARLHVVTGYLKSLPGDAPQEMRQAVWNMFDAEPVVPGPLRPNLMGDFPALSA